MLGKTRITKEKNSIKQRKTKGCKLEGREKHCTNPDDGEAKSTKHELLTKTACHKLREPKGKHCTNPTFARQSTQNKKLLNKAKL